MGNGTKRFNQVEEYISGLTTKEDQDIAIIYYHGLLNGKKPVSDIHLFYNIINEIMYKI